MEQTDGCRFNNPVGIHQVLHNNGQFLNLKYLRNDKTVLPILVFLLETTL
jgi:hypothetical protein